MGACRKNYDIKSKNDLDDDLEVAFIPMTCVSDGFRNQHTFEIKKWKEIKKVLPILLLVILE